MTQEAGKYKKILVIRFSSLGDIVLTAPLVKTLKQNFPDAQIDFCTKEEFAEAAKLFTLADNIMHTGSNFDFTALKILAKRIKQNNYDLIIDAHNNLRTFYIRQVLRFRSKVLVFKKYSFRKFLLVKFKINLMKQLPSIIDRYIAIVNELTHTEKKNRFEPQIITSGSNVKKKIDDILIENGIDSSKGFAVIAPASKHYTKTYPAELYAELINKMGGNIPVLLVGIGNDIIAAEKILSLGKGSVINLVNKLSITDLTELIARCKVFISGDTGPMHIAEAVGTPLVMIAGSSVREFGFYPVSANSIVLENNFLSCRPCSHIGRSSCPKGHFRCMKEISTDEIYTQIQKLVK